MKDEERLSDPMEVEKEEANKTDSNEATDAFASLRKIKIPPPRLINNRLSRFRCC